MGNYFIFNGINSKDYGIGISGSGTFMRPVRRVEKIVIPGRSGELSIDEGAFDNVTISYPAFIARGFERYYAEFIAAMMSWNGYCKLQDTYDPDHFRMAIFKEAPEPEAGTLNRSGKFTLEFDCQPQRWLHKGNEWGDTETAASGYYFDYHNPTKYYAKPIIRVYGYGQLRFEGLNNGLITIANPGTESIDIDCETEECYYVLPSGMHSPKNEYVQMNLTQRPGKFKWYFPVLDYEITNRITVQSDTITAIAVKTRYWTI